MLKLNASYSKKVPAGGQYSSHSYHAAVELELPDCIDLESIREKIHDTFELVRNAVEYELHNYSNSGPEESQDQKNNEPASSKQVKYLLDLAKQNKFDICATIKNMHLKDVYELSKQQCSNLINEILQGSKAI